MARALPRLALNSAMYQLYERRWRRQRSESGEREGVVMLVVLLGGILAGVVIALRMAPSMPGLAGINVAGALFEARPAPGRTLSGYQAPCAVDGSLAFEPRLAALKDQLGSVVGEPTECARPSLDNGDLIQRTTTGMAVFRLATGLSVFTNGVEHWALTPSGVAYWHGESIDPPPDAQQLAAGQERPVAPRLTAQPTETTHGEPGTRMRVARTDGEGVVLRASPRDNDWTPRGFMDGTEVTVLERQGNDWARVRGPGNQEGWVPTKYLDP